MTFFVFQLDIPSSIYINEQQSENKHFIFFIYFVFICEILVIDNKVLHPSNIESILIILSKSLNFIFSVNFFLLFIDSWEFSEFSIIFINESIISSFINGRGSPINIILFLDFFLPKIFSDNLILLFCVIK